MRHRPRYVPRGARYVPFTPRLYASRWRRRRRVLVRWAGAAVVAAWVLLLILIG